MALLSCPEREVLQRLLLGRLSGEEADRLEQHVLKCDTCAAAAETLTASDAIIEAARSRRLVEGGDEFLADAIERGKQLRSESETVESIEDTAAGTAREPQADRSARSDEKSTAQQPIDFLHPPQQHDEIGRLGGYRVLEVMGVGGMGVVFRAEDPKLERLVALKAMKPDVAASKLAKDRFLREAKATAAIEHDNIVQIYQVGEDGDVPFISMRYLRGESLQTRLKRDRKLDQREVIRIGRQVAAGLAAAHKQGLIHRDVKPDNIWIEEETQRAKILDFGLVRTATDDAGLTQSGMVLGTPRYMAPEQAQGQEVDHRGDLFSLGSVLYHLASGKPPFSGGSLTATLIAVVQEDPQPIERVCPELQEDLSRLIMRLLSKDPDERPQSAAELVELLGDIERDLDEQAREGELPLTTALPPAAATGEPTSPEVSLPQISSSSPPLRTRRRRPLVLIACGAIGALLALLGVIMVATAKGTVSVSIPDRMQDDVEVRIWGEHDVVAVLDKKNRWRIQLHAGEYKLEVRGGKDQFHLRNNRLTVTRFGRSIVQIDQTPALASEESKPPGNGQSNSKKTGWQGWALDAPPSAIAPFDAKQARAHQEAWAKYLGVPVEYENSIGMKMVLIPPGEFLMGASKKEIESLSQTIDDDTRQWRREEIVSERPQHLVELTRPFYLGVHEVTHEQFRRFIEADGYKTDAERGGPGGRGLQDGQVVRDPRFVWNANLGFPQSDRHPVVNVSWNDARAFCKWLSRVEQRAYDLPTEAQWEFACRGGSHEPWSWGADSTIGREYAWKLGNGDNHPQAVGQLLPNSFGLYDTSGNAWEICRDHRRAYGPGPAIDPTGPAEGDYVAIRGGGFSEGSLDLRAAFRGRAPPDSSHLNLGFRVKLSVEDVSGSVSMTTNKVDYALSFDGQDDFVEVPTLRYDGSHPVTVEGFIHAKPQSMPAYILGWHRVLVVTRTTTARLHGVSYSASGEEVLHIYSSEPTPTETRLHVAIVWDGRGTYTFLNGNKTSDEYTFLNGKRISDDSNESFTALADLNALTREKGNFAIGAAIAAQAGQVLEFFPGMIDEVRVSNSARYTEDFTPQTRFEPDEETLALYHFDEGRGHTLVDSSGHNHHGIIHGAAWVESVETSENAPVLSGKRATE